jgi:N-acetylneuraminic acid mutarotase
MGKKDKKSESAKEARALRQAKKAQKGDKKAGKTDNICGEDDDDDIDAILEEFRAKEEKKTAVRITITEQPTPRSNFSLTALPSGEMLMFGGEFCDGAGTVVFNDVLRWNIDKAEWKRIESLNTPPPRCSHQTVYFNDKLYMFGGEYATLDQFHHYRDLWQLDLKTNSWTEIHASGDCPSARSGHRMCVWRGYMILFGGFYEQKRDMHWYNDTYIYSFQEEKWHQIVHKPLDHVPRVRSGHQLVLHQADDCLYMYGGFSKEKMAIQDSTRKEAHVHDDMWKLDLKPILGLSSTNDKTTSNADADKVGKESGKSKKKNDSSGGSGGSDVFDASKAIWSKISRKGAVPSIRSGAVMINYKTNKSILFGGVYDQDLGHGLKSVFHSDIFSFDMTTHRWYEIICNEISRTSSEHTVIHPNEKIQAKSDDYEDDEDEEDGEDEALRGVPISVLTRLDAISLENAALVSSGDLSKGGIIGRHFNRYFNDQPCPRINPVVFLKGNNKLFIYGGVTELDDVEIALDDCWYFDLNKRNGWTCVLRGTMESFVWKGPIDNATEGTCTDDEDGEGIDGAEADRGNDDDTDSDVDNDDIDKKVSSIAPTLGESLRDFYNRTTQNWLEISRSNMIALPTSASDKEKKAYEKEIKKNAFELAEKEYTRDFAK